jgi:hypothetical protein
LLHPLCLDRLAGTASTSPYQQLFEPHEKTRLALNSPLSTVSHRSMLAPISGDIE